MVKRTGTPWLSDHLCWGGVDGHLTHDILSMSYIWEAVEWTARNIREVQDAVDVPVMVENVYSYMEFCDSEVTEREFLCEVVARADCGILLDVNYIYVSSKKHRIDHCTCLDAMPADRAAKGFVRRNAAPNHRRALPYPAVGLARIRFGSVHYQQGRS